MSSERLKRGVEAINLGDGRRLGSRAIEMEWYGDETDDDLETLARLFFEVDGEEYAEMARLGLVDSEEQAEDRVGKTRIALRTDRDLIDEEEETLQQEWEQSFEDPRSSLEVWSNLDYWEVESVT